MRIDFIFSYWIFCWYVLHIFGIITKYNPKFAIICGLIENMFIVLLMLLYNTKTKLVLLFIAMSVILKVIPLYTIWNTKINMNDIFMTFLLLVIYFFWTYMHNKTYLDFVKGTEDLVMHNKNTLPGMIFLDKILIKPKKYKN